MRCLLAFTLLLHCTLAAQPYRQLKYYLAKDGLPSGVVYKCLEDSRGYLWIGTENGLSRFDGERFTTYTTSNGLPDNEILDLFPDNQGNIWLTPFNAEPCYYSLNQGKIIDQQSNPELKKNLQHNKNLLLGQGLENGEVAFKLQNGSCTLFKNAKHRFTFNNPINYLVSVPDGYINIGNNLKTGLEFYENGQLKKVNPDIKFKFQIIQPDGKGGYYCINDSGQFFRLSQLDSRLMPNIEEIKFPFPVHKFFSLETQLVLLTEKRYIFFANKNTGVLTDSLYIPHKITTVYEDRQHNIWICTRDTGLIRIKNTYIRKKTLPALMHPCITALYAQPHVLYAANNREQFYIQIDEKWVQKKLHPSVQFSFPGKKNAPVTDFRKIVLNQQRIYLVSSAGIFASKNDTVTPFLLLKNTTTNKDLLILNDTLLFAGSSSNAYEYHLKTETAGKSYSKRITALGSDSSGNLYAGTIDGLYRWRTPLNEAFEPQNAIVTGRVIFLHTTADNIIWVGTAADSLFAIKNNHVLCSQSLKSIMPGNTPRCITSAKAGDIWVATEQALCRLKYSSKSACITGYDILYPGRDLPEGLINSLSITDDTLYSGTENGIYMLPLNLQMPVRKYEIYITDITANDKRFRWTGEQTITLRSAQNELHIYFSAADLSGLANFYEYRFNDEPWVTLTEAHLPLLGLKPGTHHIQFRLVKRSSEEEPKITELFIIKKMPVYRNPGFIITVVTAFFTTSFVLLTRRTRLRKRKKIKKLRNDRRLALLELEAIKANFHPHFIFNCLNSIKSLILQNRNTESELYLEKFSRLLRCSLEYATQKKISLQQEREFIEDYLSLEKLRLGSKMTYTIHTDEQIDTINTKVPALFSQPYLENALKHGIRHLKNKTGEIAVQFSLIQGIVTCFISDNGVGREAAQAINQANPHYHKSKGLNLAKRQAQLEGMHVKITDIKNNNNQTAGTLVLIQFSG